MLQRFAELPSIVRYGLAFLIPFAVTLLLTPFAARLARRLRLLDLPAPNKSHTVPTPYLGGAALAIGLVAGAMVLSEGSIRSTVIFSCAIAVSILGLVDDVRGLGPSVKLGVEVAAAVALYLTGSGTQMFGSASLDLPLTVLWVVVVTNSLNLLDNMDGLTPGVAMMSAAAFFAIAARDGSLLVASLAAALVGGTLGFLPYNFPPAKVFLGDAGALLVGFLLAVLGLDLIQQVGMARITIPMLVLAVPLFDTTLVVLARLRDHRSIFRGGTDHVSHRLTAWGLSPVGVALVVIGMQMVCSSLALTLYVASDGMVLAAAVLAAIVASLALLAALRLDHPGRQVDVRTFRERMTRRSLDTSAAEAGRLTVLGEVTPPTEGRG